jgi:biopolymer transport protein ExbD
MIKTVKIEELEALISVTRTQSKAFNITKKTSAEKAQVRFAIDSDKRIRFKWISDVMEALRRTRQTQFNFVTDKQQ